MKFTAGPSFRFTVLGTIRKNALWYQSEGTLTLKEALTLKEIKDDLINEASLNLFCGTDNKPFPIEKIRVKELKPLA